MPLLVAIRFTHMGPKDSEEGIKGYILAPHLAAAIGHIDREHCHGSMLDDSDEASLSLDMDWLPQHPDEAQRARDMGLEVDDDLGYVTGPRDQLVLWFEGDDGFEVDDAYYGVTVHNWRDRREITQEEADTLCRLGIATVASEAPTET